MREEAGQRNALCNWIDFERTLVTDGIGSPTDGGEHEDISVACGSSTNWQRVSHCDCQDFLLVVAESV